MPASDLHTFPCTSCGADLEFRPGTEHLVCSYCGTQNRIDIQQEAIDELDFQAFLNEDEARSATEEQLVVECDACGGQSVLETNVTADRCEFCGAKIVAQARSTKMIRPRSLLPFKVARKQAVELFRKWLLSLWFAPNALKKYARMESGINGVYCPFWTYDCKTSTRYTGSRGEHYWETETYTEQENGQTVTKTRQVQKTRWYPASGIVRNTFDDVLVLATQSLPKKHADELEPWDLGDLVPYDERFLSGFKVQSYTVPLEAGFEEAKTLVDPKIRTTIRSDIGGDEQQIHEMDVVYDDITFKHILLPVWISAYRYKEKVYRFLVNARTGEVQGERPWSWVKIAFAVLLGLMAVAAAFYVYQGR